MYLSPFAKQKQGSEVFTSILSNNYICLQTAKNGLCSSSFGGCQVHIFHISWTAPARRLVLVCNTVPRTFYKEYFVTQNYFTLRHSATKKQRLFVLFLNYSASLRSSFWGRVFFPRWLHLKHVCCEYPFQDPGDRQQQFGAERLQHDGGDGGFGDGDGDDGGAEEH